MSEPPAESAEPSPAEPVAATELTVALYPYLPDAGRFREAVSSAWQERHPEVGLTFVDWDYYTQALPKDLDVFVIDTMYIDSFVDRGELLALSEADIDNYEGLLPYAVDGCRENGTIYAVPQLLCTNLLYIRNGDTALSEVQNIDELHKILGHPAADAEGKSLPGEGLLADMDTDTNKVCEYLQALTDATQKYTDSYTPLEEETLSPAAVDSLTKIRDMESTVLMHRPTDAGSFYFARRFAEGTGRAYIGFSEAMSAMGPHVPEMTCRLFSMTDDTNIPLFYEDAAAVNARISDEKKALAIELMNVLTAKEVLVAASRPAGGSVSASGEAAGGSASAAGEAAGGSASAAGEAAGGSDSASGEAAGGSDSASDAAAVPQYLLLPRPEALAELAEEYPAYATLKEIVSVPNAHIFRIRPNGEQYMKEAEKSARILPDFLVK